MYQRCKVLVTLLQSVTSSHSLVISSYNSGLSIFNPDCVHLFSISTPNSRSLLHYCLIDPGLIQEQQSCYSPVQYYCFLTLDLFSFLEQQLISCYCKESNSLHSMHCLQCILALYVLSAKIQLKRTRGGGYVKEGLAD